MSPTANASSLIQKLYDGSQSPDKIIYLKKDENNCVVDIVMADRPQSVFGAVKQRVKMYVLGLHLPGQNLAFEINKLVMGDSGTGQDGILANLKQNHERYSNDFRLLINALTTLKARASGLTDFQLNQNYNAALDNCHLVDRLAKRTSALSPRYEALPVRAPSAPILPPPAPSAAPAPSAPLLHLPAPSAPPREMRTPSAPAAEAAPPAYTEVDAPLTLPTYAQAVADNTVKVAPKEALPSYKEVTTPAPLYDEVCPITPSAPPTPLPSSLEAKEASIDYPA